LAPLSWLDQTLKPIIDRVWIIIVSVMSQSINKKKPYTYAQMKSTSPAGKNPMAAKYLNKAKPG